MSTIRVLHIIARMNVGGTARYVGNLVESIPKSELATGFVQGAEIEDPVTGHLPVHRIPHLGRKISPIDDFKSLLELRKLIHELKPEVVHTHTFKAGLLGRLIWGHHKKVHTFHGHLFDDHSFSQSQKYLITFAERILAKRTDLLISVGEKVGSDLRAAGIGVNRDWISIPPGVTKLPKLEKGEARTLLKLHNESFVVGWMARMTSVKNPMLMLEVARRLPNIQFVMAGGGDLLDQVRVVAPDNVSVIGWTNSSIFWSAVDCGLSTSDNEGMPIALIEAQLAGVPVVATNAGSNSEVIKNGVTGIITGHTVDEIVFDLESLVSDHELWLSMSAAAMELTAKDFTLESMVSQHRQQYEDLFSG